MKRTTASDARREWFRLLDEVADGEVVMIMRKGRRIVIRREEEAAAGDPRHPDYSAILNIPDATDADLWGWDWNASGGLTHESRDRT